MTEHKLWIIKSSCGHKVTTDINYIVGDYEKPKVADKFYCKICKKEVDIIDVSIFI